MNAITRCPECNTQFRVLDEQLAMADGWVRCGQCQTVFDGKANVVAVPTPESPPATNDDGLAASGVETLATDTVPADAAPVDTALKAWGAGSATEANDTADVFFVQQAERRAFWRRPLMRWSMGLLAALLMSALLAQLAVQQRHWLAARFPASLPLLKMLCEPLACTLAPLRRVDDLVIDSATLLRRDDGVYRFEVVLKNQSPLLLAMPALELSLTNASEELLLRRVILADTWPAADKQPLAPKSSRTLRADLQVDADIAERMVNYRTLAFYP